MSDKTTLYLAIGLVLSTALTIFFLFLLIPERFVFSKKEKEGVVIICKKCNGTGETEQDANLLMAEASFAIWCNLHVTPNKCEICSKEKLCETAKNKHDEIMTKYKKIGPKIEMAICPGCMGAGKYTQYKGYRVGSEK